MIMTITIEKCPQQPNTFLHHHHPDHLDLADSYNMIFSSSNISIDSENSFNFFPLLLITFITVCYKDI